MTYSANTARYQDMQYRRCGRSGIQLPAISIGLWHNFGGVDVYEHYRETLHLAFDAGITHFDLANNYGPPPGSAEENFGRILKSDFSAYRDEMIISTKAELFCFLGCQYLTIYYLYVIKYQSTFRIGWGSVYDLKKSNGTV